VFILDADVLSNLRKSRKHPILEAWLERTEPRELTTTVVTITEIQCGVERQRASDPDYASATQAWLDRLLAVAAFQVHALDAKAAVLLGRMPETPALRSFVVPDPRQKRPKTAADLAIAAIAVTRDAVVATGNSAHFEMIDAAFPLPGIYNPFKNEWVRRPNRAHSSIRS
jgi:predicted nucleic acid-binding protein